MSDAGKAANEAEARALGVDLNDEGWAWRVQDGEAGTVSVRLYQAGEGAGDRPLRMVMSSDQYDALELVMAARHEQPIQPAENMVASTGQRLLADLSRLMGAAALAEMDANTMRDAIMDALDIYTDAQVATDDPGLAHHDGRHYASAAHDMANRLRELSRVSITSEADGLVTQALHGDPDDDAAAIEALIADGLLPDDESLRP